MGLESLFAVVVTFKRYSELEQTLNAINAQGISYDRILVIDNTPAEQRVTEILTKFPLVIWIFPSQNIASAGGFALGMKEAIKRDATWVWLFNDDSRPKNDALNSLTAALAGSFLPDLVKITHLNPDGSTTLLNWKGVKVPKKVPASSTLLPSDLITFDGALISSRVIQKIGTCDPSYFMGTYEFDFCIKAKKAGFTIATLPNGLLEDGKLGSVGGNPPWRQYYNTRNHLWLGIHLKSFEIIGAWIKREAKQTGHILIKGDRKAERILFKFRAVRDAIFNRRGMMYNPQHYQ